MTFFLHTAKGTMADGSFWSFGLVTSGSVSEAGAETTWSGAVDGFFTDANVTTYYTPGFTLVSTATSTASSTFKQTTKSTTSLGTAGTSTGEQLPVRNSVLLSLYTAQATRWGRGRMTLPAPSTTVLATDDTGHIAATPLTNLASAAAGLFSALSTGSLSPVIVHRTAISGGPSAFSTTAIASGLIYNHFDTQRRRGDKTVPSSHAFVV